MAEKGQDNMFPMSQFNLDGIPTSHEPHGECPHLAKLSIRELWNMARTRIWQTLRSQSVPNLIVVWNAVASRPRGNYTAFISKYLVDDQVLVHGMRHDEYQLFLPWERNHSFNIMTGFYFELDNILTIYLTWHFKWHELSRLWAEAWWSSLKMQKYDMITRSNSRTKFIKLRLM